MKSEKKCSSCKLPAAVGRSRCKDCLERDRKYQQQKTLKRKQGKQIIVTDTYTFKTVIIDHLNQRIRENVQIWESKKIMTIG